MRSSQVTAGLKGRIEQFNNLRDDAKGAATLLAHQKGTPDLQVYVEPGAVYFGPKKVTLAGGNSPTFTAPATNPRIDALCIKQDGTLLRVAGAENASPVAPNVPSYAIPICLIYNRVGQTTVRDTDTPGQGYIYEDIRNFLELRADLEQYSMTWNADGSIDTMTDTDTGTVYTFTYNGDGNVATISDSVHTWTLSYNSAGLLSSVVKT